MPIEIPMDQQLWDLLTTETEGNVNDELTPALPQVVITEAPTEPSDTTNGAESLLPPPFGIDSTRPSSETTRTLVPEQTQQADDITIASIKIPVKTQIFEADVTSCYSHSMPVVIESSDLSKDRHNIGYRMCHLIFSNFAYDSGHFSEFNGMALSAINARLHAVAWKSHFPTKSEEVLWKVSIFGMILCPFLTWIVCLRGDCVGAAVDAVWELRCCNELKKSNILKKYQKARYSAAWRIKQKAESKSLEGVDLMSCPGWSWLFTVDVTCILFGGYTFSIIYFAVEAFISVRSLPEGSYDLPSWNWTTVMPHF
jgi:hypothetical protein